MMRYVILAILIYIVYLVVKSIAGRISERNKSRVEDGTKKKKDRSYDVNQVEDAEFREVNKNE
ncbi:MAG: hypothetical protein L0Y79_00930 [Chlorobi bacterium]|nr:hypothetical protein [Chlorobiota bacterium]MCI0716693.1 hypothetical protein [Chlorobiota bacterium]